MPQDAKQDQRGLIFGFSAYAMWGVFPLFYHNLAPSSSIEILAHRIVWSMVFCVICWCFMQDRAWLRELWSVPSRITWLVVAATVLTINWGGYIYAVRIGNVVEASLGYFINPLVLVMMGVLILHERLRPLQWLAMAVGAIAVLVIAIDYGRPPWIALLLAFSFAIYGFIKKRLGGSIGAMASMTVESLAMTPFALGVLLWIEVSGRGTFSEGAPWHPIGLLATGPLTAVPLICFAIGASRVPLSTMGMLQFIAPIMQLGIGVLVFGETLTPVRWIGFGLVWVALMILTTDSVRTLRGRRIASRNDAMAS